MAIKKNIPKKKPAKKRLPKKPPLTEAEQKALDEENQLQVEEKKRADWELNNEVIAAAFLKLCLKGKKFPSYASVAEVCNLNERTVRRHFEQASVLGDQTQKLQVLRDRSLLTIAVKAIQGKDVHWNRLFHEITDNGGVGGRIRATATATTTPVAGPTEGKIEQEVTLQIF